MIYKLVVVSDIHHDMTRLNSILHVINVADYLIFCGDGFQDLLNFRGNIAVPMVCVRGNNDINTNITDVASVVLGGTRALVTHGHRQNVLNGYSALVATAHAKGCKLAFFGHTHRYVDAIVDGVHIINPGSLSNGSYALVIGDGINFTAKQQLI